MSGNTSTLRREPTVWTRRLRLLTSVYSVVTTVGTALVLGYVTPGVLEPRTTATASEIDAFLPGFRAVGIAFVFLNAIGIAALWNKTWVFRVALLGCLLRYRSDWAHRRVSAATGPR